MYLTSDEPALNLRCVSVDGHGDLQWQTTGVAALPSALDNSLDIEGIEIIYNGDRDVSLVLHPFTEVFTGTFTCASQESGFVSDVIATLTNPYWQVVTPSVYEEPIGVELTIMAIYGDFSFGYINVGQGFLYELKFVPCVETLPDEVLASGQTNNSSNQLMYSFIASFDRAGDYQLTGKSNTAESAKSVWLQAQH